MLTSHFADETIEVGCERERERCAIQLPWDDPFQGLAAYIEARHLTVRLHLERERLRDARGRTR